MVERGRSRMRRVRGHNVYRTKRGNVTVSHTQAASNRRRRVNPAKRERTRNVNGHGNFYAVQFYRSRHLSHVQQASKIERHCNGVTVTRVPNTGLLRMDVNTRATDRSRVTRLNRRVNHEHRQVLRARGVGGANFNGRHSYFAMDLSVRNVARLTSRHFHAFNNLNKGLLRVIP